MAYYQILSWKHLPSQVKAFQGANEVTEPLPQEFQEAIDREAMRTGEFGTDAYLEGWSWSEERELPGTPEEVLRAVVDRCLSGRPPA